MAYVIIGNSAAGVAAAQRIRQVDKSGKITIISDEPYQAYSRCLTSYYLAGRVREEDMYFVPAGFYQDLGIDFRPGEKAAALDVDSKEVVAAGGRRYPYDKLLIATGASAKTLNVPGIDADGVFTLRTLADAKKIAAACSPGGRAVILGGGLVSLKVAAALKDRGMEVFVLVSSNRVMSRTLAEHAAALVEQRLVEMGIRVIKNTQVAAINASDAGSVSGVATADYCVYPADVVIIGKGVKPNSGFLAGAGLVEKAGEALQVNRYQETGFRDIYAAGDVALAYDILQEEYGYNAIWPNASEQGAIAGLNMAGASKEYAGSIPMNSAGFGGLSVIAAGITRPEGDGYQVMEEQIAKDNYRMLVLKEGRLVGYTLIGDTARAGVYTGIIKSRKQFTGNRELWPRPRRFVTLAGLG